MKQPIPRILFALTMAFLWVLLSSPNVPVFAEQNEIVQLRKKLAELENRVKVLETLLEECHQARLSESTTQFGWQNKKSWRSLKVGMNASQVLAVLGAPVKVIKGVNTLWYYPNLYGGFVSFDEKGKLTAWNEP